MNTATICALSAIDLAAALRRRELSAVEALDAVQERAEQIAGLLNPFTIGLDGTARKAALRADAALAAGDGGVLCGVPVTTKDSHWMAGVESTAGSLTRRGFVPTETLGAIRRLEGAGAVVFARTTVPEFCYFGVTESALFGVTRNPWNRDRTAGGSSGGCAVAVAAGAGPLSLGGDGGGSIRIPAAFCGVVGFKPTFGVVPHEPSGEGWKTLVSAGPLARSVADVRLMMSVVAGFDPRDRHSVPPGRLDVRAPEPGQLRVAVSGDLGFAAVDDDVLRAYLATLERLAAAGVELVEDRPLLAGSSARTWATIALAEARYSESREFAATEELTQWAAAYLAAGGSVGIEDYVRAQFAREGIHRAYADLFERTGASVLLTPTVGCEAFGLGVRHPVSVGGVPVELPDLDWAPFLYDANLAGLPGCAMPMGFGDDGLPVSLQIQGRRFDDGVVLAAAETIESILAPSSPPVTPRSPDVLHPLGPSR